MVVSLRGPYEQHRTAVEQEYPAGGDGLRRLQQEGKVRKSLHERLVCIFAATLSARDLIQGQAVRLHIFGGAVAKHLMGTWLCPTTMAA